MPGFVIDNKTDPSDFYDTLVGLPKLPEITSPLIV